MQDIRGLRHDLRAAERLATTAP
ncbi:MAG: hypothetical protein JWO31_306, partial [Phycisphaerales bacterium]|nr:hypothetical protein [Phycisphaerales bacterium]